jgi:hypothetical protein
MRRLMLAVVVLLCMAGMAAAAEYYASPTGTEANPCTLVSPCNIGKAAGMPAPGAGDTVWIRGGNYTVTVNSAQIMGGTSWANATKILQFPGETAIINWTTGNLRLGTDQNYIIVAGEPGNRMVFLDGVPRANTQATSHHHRFAHLELKNTNNISIVNFQEYIDLNVHECSGHCFYSSSQSDVLLDGGEYHDPCIAANPGSGAQIFQLRNAVRWTIRNAKWYIQDCNNHPVDNAVWLGPNLDNTGTPEPGTSGTDVKIYNNEFYNWPCGMLTSHGTNTQVVNNTFYAVRKQAISGITDSTCSNSGVMRFTNTGSIVMNNIFRQIGTAQGIKYDSSSAQNTSTVSNNINVRQGSNSGMVEVDPLFTNPGALNFTLQAGSPAIDTGATLSLVATDKAGISRPQGAAYDIGAHERTGAVAFDYRLSVGAPNVTAEQADATIQTVTVDATQGTPASVTLSVTGLPPGVTASFSGGASCTPDCSKTLTLTTTATTPLGTFPLVVKGTSGVLNRTASFNLIVICAGGA